MENNQINADDILIEAADTFRQRREIYGDNWKKVSKILKAMFPSGISLKTESDFVRFEFIILAVIKLSRYSNNFELGGHKDSVRDCAVYSAMLEAFDSMESKGEFK
jgi:hypothetical protein